MTSKMLPGCSSLARFSHGGQPSHIPQSDHIGLCFLSSLPTHGPEQLRLESLALEPLQFDHDGVCTPWRGMRAHPTLY